MVSAVVVDPAEVIGKWPIFDKRQMISAVIFHWHRHSQHTVGKHVTTPVHQKTLPILSAVSQIAMTKIMGTAQQPAAQGQGAGSGKFLQYFFPIFSMVICLSYSSAFALYWVAGNLTSMGQTYAINKYLDNKEKAASAVAGEGSVK